MIGRGLLVTVVAAAFFVAPALAVKGGAAHSAAVAPCSPQVNGGGLPAWMRGGVGPGPRRAPGIGERGTGGAPPSGTPGGFGRGPLLSHAGGKRGPAGPVLGNKPPSSPPAQHVNNNTPWAPRRFSKRVAPLWIKMQKMDGTQLVGAPVRR